MKKILVGTLLFGLVSLMADMDIKGQITAVDNANKTITIQGVRGVAVIQILPYTKLQGDDCGAFGNDVHGTFNDLVVGKFVDADVYPANMPMQGMNSQGMPEAHSEAQFVAKEVEWKCGLAAY